MKFQLFFIFFLRNIYLIMADEPTVVLPADFSAIPSGIRYTDNLKRLPPQGVSYLDREFDPINKTEFSQDGEYITVPFYCAPTGFMEPAMTHVEFAVSGVSNATSYVNPVTSVSASVASSDYLELTGSAHDLFDHLQLVTASGQVLEDIPEYNVIANMLRQSNESYSYSFARGYICDGSGDFNIVSASTGVDISVSYNASLPVTGMSAAGDLTTAISNSTQASNLESLLSGDISDALYPSATRRNQRVRMSGVKRYFSLKLMAGLFNTESYLPLGQISNGLRLRLRLAPKAQLKWSVYNPNVNRTISDFKLKTRIVSMDNGQVQQLLAGMRQQMDPQEGSLMYSFTSFNSGYLTQNSSGWNINIVGERLGSMKSVIWRPILSASRTAYTTDAINTSTLTNLQSWYLSIAGTAYPNNKGIEWVAASGDSTLNAPDGRFSDAFIHLQNAFATASDSQHGLMCRDYIGNPIFALDTESLPFDPQLASGIDTGSTITLVAQGSGTIGGASVDVFIARMYDATLVVRPDGTAFVQK